MTVPRCLPDASCPSARLSAILSAAALLTLGLTACGTSHGSDADRALHRYLAAWDHRDWSAMRPLLSGAPHTLVRDDSRSLATLGVTQAHFEPERITRVSPGSMRARVRVSLRLRGLGAWHTSTFVSLTRHHGRRPRSLTA